MSLDPQALRAAVAGNGPVVRILIARAAGSAPRGAGTSMLVWGGGACGTIGGGTLEHRAILEARAMLAEGRARQMRAIPLGPALGQCCGGSVTLVWERFTQETIPDALPWLRQVAGPEPLSGPLSGPLPERLARRAGALTPGSAPLLVEGWLAEAALAARRPLWIFGAGHVGRALAATLAPLPDFAITWVDTAAERFPEALPDGVLPRIAADPAAIAGQAPAEAEHLILTYSHEMDLALCHALLCHEFAGAGLIGSATKWARFRSRLAALGHPAHRIARIACPIGDPLLGRDPQAIAIGVAARLLAKGPARLRRTG
jgi:xanthine dehydrogenase accessory factor